MNFKAKLSRVAIAVAVAAGLAGTATAQTTTSSIRGNVVTEAGSDLSGATVTIKHEPTGTSSVATTNENGTFSSRGLRVGGPYTITISGDGDADREEDPAAVPPACGYLDLPSGLGAERLRSLEPAHCRPRHR